VLNDWVVPLAEVPVRSVAGEDLADVIADRATGRPLLGTIEVAGPEELTLGQLARRWLEAVGDDRVVVSGPTVSYLGAELSAGDRSLLPRLVPGERTFGAWLARQRPLTVRSS
jgi:uncharacterized protein YbjT (DUF2867 family)